MYTKPIYSPAIMARWTRWDTLLFLVLSAIPVVIYDVLGQRWLHFPWLPIALIGTAVAFILSFQNNATYGRIWEARKIWGAIVNTSRAWAIMVNDFITNEFTDDKSDADELRAIKHELILRHVAWLTTLRHAMRQPRPWEQFDRHRTNQPWIERMQIREFNVGLEEDLDGYLTPDERSRVLGKANPSTEVISLQSQRLRELRTRGLIEDFRHMAMEQVLVDLLESQGRSERIKNFPYPRQYATLNSMFLWIFLLLLPFGLVFEFAKIGAELEVEYPRTGHYFVWLTVPFSAVVMWVFHTMERVGRVGENPFEGSANDVPITTMSRGVEIEIRQIVDDDPASIPPPIEAKHGTQT